MHAVVIALRLLHIVFGVYWVGAILFFVTFLQPSLRDAGPDGMKVVQQIVRRGYLNILPVIAGLTMLAGLVLYWQDAKAMDGVWMSSGIGRALSVAPSRRSSPSWWASSSCVFDRTSHGVGAIASAARRGAGAPGSDGGD